MNGSGKYIEVGTGEVVDDMRRRYILNAQVMDFTNTTFVNIFNEQAEEILGMGADELNAVKVSCCWHLIRLVSAKICLHADVEFKLSFQSPCMSGW